MGDGTWFRDEILERYDFTPRAREILGRIPVEIEDPGSQRGGGYWNPTERRIFLFGAQDEACLHELSHAWADEAGFYQDPHPDNPSRRGRHFAFRQDVERAAQEADPRYRRVAFLAWEYTHGNPVTGFAGMKELDWERFAGLASGIMGDTRLMPPYLRRWYDDLFGGNPKVPGPSQVPSTRPSWWHPGADATRGSLLTTGRIRSALTDLVDLVRRALR